MIWLVGIFALIIGAVLGLFGGGGSILAVPVLVHIAGLGSKEAIAMSLLVVGATSVIGALHHARHGNVDWHAGLTFAPFAMAGAFMGGLFARFIPGALLLALFAVMMVVTASVDYTLATTLVVLAVVGTFGGAAASKRIAAHRLRAGFAYFVLVIGVFMLMEPLGWPPYTIALLAAAVLALAVSLKQWNDHRTQPQHP